MPGRAPLLHSRGFAVAPNAHRYSLLKQPLDRAAFVAYLLGAVVPLAALAWVIQTWVRPERLADTPRTALVGLLVAIGLLSLASFLVLRTTAHRALSRLDRDNRALAHLLDASGSLAASADDEEILRLTAESAHLVAESASAHVLGRNREGEFVAIASYPEGSLSEAVRGTLATAAEAAAETLRPMVRGGEATGDGSVALAVPFAPADGRPGAIVAWHDGSHPREESETKTLSTLASLARVALRNADHNEAERNFFTHATNLLVATLDRYLGDRSDHSRRVASLANMIGRTLELPESRLERLHFAALLHDIGMLRVPREHLYDLEEIRRHPELGDEMLRPIRIWDDLAPLVRHHHEWYDGAGYPDGLAGDAIPIEARIIAVAEAYDAMTADRNYQRAISTHEAAERIRAGAGSQFDPVVAAAFARLLDEGALGG